MTELIICVLRGSVSGSLVKQIVFDHPRETRTDARTDGLITSELKYWSKTSVNKRKCYIPAHAFKVSSLHHTNGAL